MVTEPLVVGQSVGITSNVLDINGNPSKATEGPSTFTSSDPTVFTVGSDPTNPLAGIAVTVGAGSATVTETCTCTEPDGTTTEKVSGSATLVVAAAPPPPPPPAGSLDLVFGTPFPTPPAVPTP